MKKKNLLMTAIAILGLATITMAQVPSYVPTSGLVGWWPFNGNANDVSGNGNNGTVNGAVLTTDRFSNANSAINFDGTGQHVEIPHDANGSLDPNTGSFSISVWFNTSSSVADPFFEKKRDTGYVFWNSIAGEVKLRIEDDQANQLELVTPLTYNDGNWHHAVAVRDVAADSVHIYIDGLKVTSRLNSTVTSVYSNEPLYIGKWGQSAHVMNGSIDDVGFWKAALTQQEISDLYYGCQLSVNTQPTNQTINVNKNAQFVVGSSDSSATYQWQTDLGVGFQNLNSVGQYSGTTNDTITVSNVTMSNNNQPFRCIVSSGSCSDTSNVAVLTVNNNVGINETSQDMLFSVFPNPAQSVINVKADSKLFGSVYSIYDNTGRVVLTGKLNSQNTTIELGNLSGGIYMFSVGANMKQSFKVIKE